MPGVALENRSIESEYFQLPRMRLRHLEIFHAVMRSGSVSGAAVLLNLSQSAASKALAQAEHALGLKLFQRVQGRLVRTREAEQLFARTTLLFAEVESVQRLARNLTRNPEAHLRIGCLPSLGLGLIPGAVRDFRRSYPSVTLEISTGNGDELVDQLLARALDIAICFDAPPRPAIAQVALGEIHVVHLSSPDESNPVADVSSPVKLDALNREAWIGIGGEDPVAEQIRACWTGLTESPVFPSIETRTYYVAAALARQGLGFALVDELTATAIGQDMQIRPIAPRITVQAVALHLASDSSFFALDAFLASLLNGFSRFSGYVKAE